MQEKKVWKVCVENISSGKISIENIFNKSIGTYLIYVNIAISSKFLLETPCRAAHVFSITIFIIY